MRRQVQFLLLTLASLPLVSAGCTTSRNHLTSREPSPSHIVRSEESESLRAVPSSATTEPSLVQTVAFQNNEGEDATSALLGGSPQFPDPVEIELLDRKGDGLTLEAIEQMALANNPAIQQANAASARAGAIRTQVGLKPNPTMGYNGTQLGDAGTDQHTAFIEQTFVRGDKLAWNQQVINNDVRELNWMVESQRQRILTDVRLAFYDALASQKRLQLAREFREIAAKGVDVSKQQVEAKVGTRPDVLQSEIQLNEVDLTIQLAEFQLQAAMNELSALCGGTEFGETLLVGQLENKFTPGDTETVYSQIVAANPLLAAAQVRVERARANIQRQQVQPIPNLTAQLGAGYDNGTGQGLINMQVGLPIPIHNKNQGNIQAAQAEYCNAIKNVERLQMSIRQQLARVMREYNVAEATVMRYEQAILPKAEETLTLMQEAQAAGEFDFLRVLTARRAYFDANLRYVTALGELAQSNAQIDGLLLSGGLSQSVTYDGGDDLRGQAMSGQ